jgi:hypothetical protein
MATDEECWNDDSPLCNQRLLLEGKRPAKEALLILGFTNTENKAKAGKVTGNVISPNSRTQKCAAD